jgi:hypothetical protein
LLLVVDAALAAELGMKGWADTFEAASRKRTAGEKIGPPPTHGDQERPDEPHEEVLDIDIVSEVDAS